MTRRSTSPLALRAQLALAALGPGPLLLAAALTTWLVLWLVALPTAEQRLREAESTLRAARSGASRMAVPSAQPTADALASFRARLSDDDDIAKLAQQVWRQAAASGVQVRKVDWRVEADAGQPFGRVRVVVPMSGSYAAIRRFAFDLLATFPALALDRLDLRREQSAVGALEGTAHFTLYVLP